MLQALIFSLSVTSPILFMLMLGYVFRQRAIIGEEFIKSGSKLVFNVTLPCLLFLNVATADVLALLQPTLIISATLIICVAVALLWTFSAKLSGAQRGVFVQGAFRGNMGIVGLASVVNAFGDQILAAAGVYLALMTIVYNVLAVVVLSASQRQPNQNLLRQMLKSMLTNPLIIAISFGLLLAFANLRLPTWLMTSGRYLADMTLPLALLCIGGSLSFGRLRGNRKILVWATLSKLVFVPAFAVVVGALLGFRGENLGIMYLMIAAPTAAASFVMAHQMKGDADLAADIIAMTTIFTALSSTIGLLTLRTLALI